MLRPVRALPALAVVAVTIVACGSSAAAPEHGTTASAPAGTQAAAHACGPAAGHTIASSRVARVYAVGKSVYGCSGRTGKVTRLGASGPCVGSQHVGPAAVAGELAGYGLQSCGVDTGSSLVVVRRLSDGRVLVSQAATTQMLGPESYSSVGSLVLRSDGSVAWIGLGSSIIRHTRDVEVHRAAQHGQALLDSGTTIDPTSLRLHGSRMTWRHGKTTRSATLR